MGFFFRNGFFFVKKNYAGKETQDSTVVEKPKLVMRKNL